MKIENFICESCSSSIRAYSMISYACPFCGNLLKPENTRLEEKFTKDISEVNDKKIDEVIRNIDKIKKMIKNPQLVAATETIIKMIQILLDKEVQFKTKAIITAALLYLLSPIDLIPDFTPAIGFLDDLGIIMLAANMLLHLSDNAVQKYNLNVKHHYQAAPIIYSVVNNHNKLDYNYIEENGRRIVVINVEDVKRHNYKMVNDTLIKAPEQYLIHPYLSNTLVPLNRFDNILSEHLIREQANIAKMLGARKIEFKITNKWNNKSGGNLKISKNKVAEMSNGFDFTNYKEEKYVQYDELGEYHSIPYEYINDFVWFFTYDNVFSDLVKERLLNNSISKKVRTELVTATHLDLSSRVNIAKKNALNLTLNFSKIVKCEVEMDIEFFELPDEIKNKNKEYYLKIIELLTSRRNEIESSLNRYVPIEE